MAKAGESGSATHLRQPVVVAEIDEEQPAMVADAMHPARKAHGLADIAGAKLAAGLAAIAVHEEVPGSDG